jgi:transposase
VRRWPRVRVVVSVSAFTVDGVVERVEAGEVRSAMEWAQVRALAADGVSQREIAARLGINRRTVARLAAADEPPSYQRAPRGSMLDPFEPVLRRLLEQWPEIKAPRVTEILRESYGYVGSVDLVKKRLAGLRPSRARPAQRTGYRPGQVLQLDWAEMPTRPRIAGRERRVYALIASLPFSGAQTAHFSFDLAAESFLEGHVRALGWLGGVPRECVYDNLRSVVARRDGDVIQWNPRFVALRGHYAFHATACTPATPREKGAVEGAVRHLKTGFWPARRIASLADLDEQYADWRDRVCNRRRHATGGFWVHERLDVERDALRALPPACFDYAGRRSTRVPLDGYLKLGGCFYRAPEPLVHQRVELRFDRDRVWISHRGQVVARYIRSYDRGRWFPPPRLRPEPPAPPPPVALVVPAPTPPELADYAQLCA